MASNKPKFPMIVLVETPDGIVAFRSKSGTVAYTSSTTFDGKITKSEGSIKVNGPFKKLTGDSVKAFADVFNALQKDA